MPIRVRELFHGAVLTKLVYSKEPVTLRMIETESEARAVYTVNMAVIVYVKHCASSKQDEEGCLRWSFTFTEKNLRELCELPKQKGMELYLALVCGQSQLGHDQDECEAESQNQSQMEICFLNPGQVERCLDLQANRQSIRVTAIPGRKLRVASSKIPAKDPLLVSRRALEDWTVPGS